jgi:hypothetical protein
MVVNAQFYKSPVGRKRRVEHMINTRSRFIQGFEESTIVRSRWVKDISERALETHSLDPGAQVSLGFFVLHDPIEVTGEDYDTAIFVRTSVIDPPGGYGFGVLSWSKTLWAIVKKGR